MRYPKEIMVGDVLWKVKHVDKIKNEKTTVGYCDYETEEIILRKDQTDDEKLDTFIHELFHAIEGSYEIRIPHKLIYKLSPLIAQLIKENFL